MSKGRFCKQLCGLTGGLIAVFLISQENVNAQGAKAIASEQHSSGARVDLLEVKRTSGGTVTLKFAVVNDSKEDIRIDEAFSEHGYNDWDVARVALLDTPNKKKYLVMRDSEKNCVCSRGKSGDHQIKGGTSRTLWAKFQAPPENVNKIAIEIPGTPPFEDIPISQ